MNTFDLDYALGYSDANSYCWDPNEEVGSALSSAPIAADLSEIREIGRETRERLQDYGIPVFYRPVRNKSIHGMEVGDDRADVDQDPRRLATALVCQSRVIGMRTSEMDTFISNHIWNFCEVTNVIPSCEMGSFHHARRTGNFKDLEYTDTIILRIIIDCSKGDNSHSSTAVGKASMLASRINTPRAEHRSAWMLASWYQDACLRTVHSPDPKYLPSIMGGSGCRALFDEPRNLFLSVKAYRGGGYDRLYGTATREVDQCLSSLDKGIGSNPTLCLRLRDRQDYLHGTYAEKVLVPPKSIMKFGVQPLPEPLYLATGGQNRYQSFENRLLRTKTLLGRRDAEREVERTLKVSQAIFGAKPTPIVDLEWKRERFQARKKFGMALQANTAFKHLLDKKASVKDVSALIEQGFLSINTGVTEFSEWDALFLFSGAKKGTVSIEDLTCSEDMFLRKDVSTEESFKVGGIRLNPIVGRQAKPTTTVCKVGLYQINSTMEEWATSMESKLQEAREEAGKPLQPWQVHKVFDTDPEWVNDDTMLIAQCLRDTGERTSSIASVILVSGDRRLANQMANTCNVTVIRCMPSDIIRKFPNNVWTSMTELPVHEVWNVVQHPHGIPTPACIYLDTGSVASACSNMASGEAEGLAGVIYRKDLIETGWDASGKRYARYTLTEVDTVAAAIPEIHIPVLRPRRYRSTRPLNSVYSIHGSDRSSNWRSRGPSSR